MNKLIIHYCGGAGLNMARDMTVRGLHKQGKGFCEVINHFVDTSDNNIGDLDQEQFWKVTSDSFDNAAIDGSGGERRSNADAIMTSIGKYLDTHSYKAETVGEYHAIVFSGSGGSGSVCGSALIRYLRERDIPVIGIMIGDSGSGLSCKNTMNTIATIDHIAKNMVKKAVVMMYYNNYISPGEDYRSRELDVNTRIYNALTIMSVFLSGSNDDLDSKDMINFLSPDKYSSITIIPGLYCVNIYLNDNIDNDAKCVNLIGRTLCTSDTSSSATLTLLQSKMGKILEPNVSKVIGDITPIHMILAGECLTEEHKLLSNTVKEYDAIMQSLTNTDLAGSNDAEESGMIF
jgi:hypothetical protein